MALTAADLRTLDYAFGGQPFVAFAPAATGTSGLDVAFTGQPFSAPGVAALVAALAVTEAADSVTSVCVVAAAAALAVTEANDTAAAQAVGALSTALAATEAADSVAAVALVASAFAAILVEADDTVAGQAAGALAATAAATESPDTASSGAGAALSATAIVVEGDDALNAGMGHYRPLSAQHAGWLEGLARLHGLIDPLAVGPTLRSDGTVVQSVADASGVVTLTTLAAPGGAGGPSALDDDQAGWLEALARVHGLVDPLVVTASTRGDGTLLQTLSEVGGVTAVVRLQ